MERIDKIDLLSARRDIVLNSPHIEEATGQTAEFTTDLKCNTKSVEIKFDVIQNGSGDPSPSNVRSFSAWSGLSLNEEDEDTYLVDWENTAGDVYGGYIDLVSGILTETHKKLIISGSNLTQSKINIIYRDTTYDTTSFTISDPFNGQLPKFNPSTNYQECKFDYLKTVASTDQHTNIWTGYIVSPYYVRVIGRLSDMSDKAGILSYLTHNPLTVVYELANPIIHRLTPQQIKTIKGQNRFYSDPNTTTTVRYWAHN